MSGLPGAYEVTAEAGTRVKCLRHWGLRTWNALQEVVHVVRRAGLSHEPGPPNRGQFSYSRRMFPPLCAGVAGTGQVNTRSPCPYNFAPRQVSPAKQDNVTRLVAMQV